MSSKHANVSESTDKREQFKEIQKWFEYELYELDQMVQTLQDYYTLDAEDVKHLNLHAKRTMLSMLPALVDSIFIRIARMTECSEKCGHKNLSLGTLVLMLRELDEAEKAKKIQSLLDDLKAKSYSVREQHRNQRFAHVDYAVAMEGKKLPPIPVQLLREITDAMETLVIEATDSGFSFKATPQGNIKKLALCLKEYFEMKTARSTADSNAQKENHFPQQ